MSTPRTLVAVQLKKELLDLFDSPSFGDDPERDTAKMLEVLSEYCWYITPQDKALGFPHHIR